MSRQGRIQLALGIVLILIGILYLADRSIPSIHEFTSQYTGWPFSLIGLGAILLLIGLVIGVPGLSVPAAVVAGIGGIFYIQELNEDYASWTYIWTLIPGFVGVGSMIAGLLGDKTIHNLRRGLNLMVVSAVLFLAFSSFFGGWSLLGNYGPAILLILLGLWVIGRSLYKNFNKRKQDQQNKASEQ